MRKRPERAATSSWHWMQGAAAMLLLCALAAMAGPVYDDLQSIGMGRTGVALAESRKTLYTNPAGLRHLSLPFSMGMPLTVGLGDFAFKALDFLNANRDIFEQGVDSIAPERAALFYTDLRQFDRKDFTLNGQIEAGLATRWFAAGGYFSPEFRGCMDMGIFSPWMQSEINLNFVLQSGFALGRRHSWSVGMAPKILGQVHVVKTVVPASRTFDQMDSARAATAGDTVRNADPFSHFDSVKTISALALDVGFQKRIRRHSLGLAISDMGKGKGALSLKPALALGYAWKADTTVKSFFKRNTILAVDIRELGLPGHLLSKLNAGYERRANLWFVFDGALRLGISGGYPTLGIGLGFLKVLHLDYATYARELGDYPGQSMDRKHLFQLEFGF